MLQLPVDNAGQGVKFADAVNLVPKELHPDRPVPVIGGVNLHRIPPDPEAVALKGHVVALIADFHQTAQQFVPAVLRPHAQGDDQIGKIIRFSQPVDTGDGSHHNHVPPFQQGTGGGQAQAVNLVIYGGVFGDIGIRMGDIRLRLVVVIVADEIFHGVVGKKLLKLRAQLGGKGLVMGQHQRGTLHALDHFRHGEGLSGTGHAQQDLFFQPVLDARRQRVNCLRLVPGGLVFRYDFEFH